MSGRRLISAMQEKLSAISTVLDTASALSLSSLSQPRSGAHAERIETAASPRQQPNVIEKELEQDLERHRATLRALWEEHGALQAKVSLLENRYRRATRLTRWVGRLRDALSRAPGFFWLAYFALPALRAARTNPKQAARLLRHLHVARASGLFDRAYYESKYWDIGLLGVFPMWHYVRQGWREGRDPAGSFSTTRYLLTNPDVANADVCPLVHYWLWGRQQGRRALPVDAESAAPPQRPDEWVSAKTGSEPLSPYDVRPDDPVIETARAGAEFMDRFFLSGPRPAWDRAVNHLNALTPKLTITDDGGSAPDVSILIPVYGQLSHTLNCLESLFQHASRYSVEVLILDDASPDGSADILSQVKGVRFFRASQNRGYLRNCNNGAAHARGTYLVHLNNDTRVAAGWLDALIDHFTVHPQTGVVGSKLLYPNGTLQEAGGIIWRDGSAWNYGRNDDPNRPEYCYARQVDYCSAAAIATPRAVWEQLGGYDEIYAPAYGEDSDYAMRVRHVAGLEVWYQPLARVVHYEGVTSGTDVSSGVKAHQVVNGEKFARRWASALQRHRPNGEAPQRERERAVRGRVLVLDAVTPEPTKDAGSLTCFEIMRAMQALGYGVSFLPTSNFLYLREPTSDLQRVGVKVGYAPFVHSVEAYLAERPDEFDAILVFRVGVAAEHLKTIRRHAPKARVIFHSSDLHFLREEREAEVTQDAGMKARARATKAKELELIGSVDATIVHSTTEKELLTQLAPSANVEVFPWILDPKPSAIGFDPRRNIAFLGGYRHPPNVDAVHYFVAEVWPRVRAQRPDMKFLVVGSETPPSFDALHGRDGVEIVGFVPELDAVFDQLRLSVAPIRYGAGIKGKVAMSLAHGVPVVCTSCAAEGMGLEDGACAIVADDPQDFADAIVSLYDDPVRWASMSKASMAFVAETYGSALGRRRMQDILRVAGVPVTPSI